MKKIILLLFTTVFIYSCGTTKDMSVIHYYPPSQEEIEVMGPGQIVSDDAVLIGNINIGDTGFTLTKNCTYGKVIQEASIMAQQMGGNILFVVSHKEPDFECTCHRINANVYKILK